MAEPDRITDTDDSALDALLSTLTDPGEDPAFRARVLSRLDVSVDHARPSLPGRWAVAGALAAALLVVVAFYAWRPAGPADRAAAVVPSASTEPGAVQAPAATAASGAAGVTGAPLDVDAPGGRTTTPRSPTTSRAPVQQEARLDVAVEEPLPYGMERIRLEPVSIQPFALREVREDPTLAALMPPDPVRVDPIDIDEIAPRR